jgi:hypothetical protein
LIAVSWRRAARRNTLPGCTGKLDAAGALDLGVDARALEDAQ